MNSSWITSFDAITWRVDMWFHRASSGPTSGRDRLGERGTEMNERIGLVALFGRQFSSPAGRQESMPDVRAPMSAGVATEGEDRAMTTTSAARSSTPGGGGDCSRCP